MADLQAKERRSALRVISGVLVGVIGVALLTPSLIFLSDPLRRRRRRKAEDTPNTGGDVGGLPRVKVAQLDEIPDLDAGAAPLRAPVVAAGLRDAWNRLDSTKLGSVFLGKRSGSLVCLSATCPHAGCGIDFDENKKHFVCPCHNSTFAIDGSHTAGPSPRGMDSLEANVEGGTVYCLFQRFRLAVSNKVPA